MDLAVSRISENTRIALDTKKSVVVNACAGSGKTWLLASRILVLLLDGIQPSEILAITFTNKAANEMRHRIANWLGFLLKASDEEILKFWAERGVVNRDKHDLIDASRGMYESYFRGFPAASILTFHSWFAKLLKRAPLTEPYGSEDLLKNPEPILEESWSLFWDEMNENSSRWESIAWIFEEYSIFSFKQTVEQMLGFRAERFSYKRKKVSLIDEIWSGFTSEDEVIANRGLQNFDLLSFNDIVSLLRRNGLKRDLKKLDQLELIDRLENPRIWFSIFYSLFKSARTESRAMESRLGADDMKRLISLDQKMNVIAITAHSELTNWRSWKLDQVIGICGDLLIDCYQRVKRRRQVCDFDDLEINASQLLCDSAFAESMVYRLDSKYSNVLVDEFQDTNPTQWKILREWIEASTGTDSEIKVFLVGDAKQSIYRFRRADARIFSDATDYLVSRLNASVITQNESYRCAPEILTVVNRCFQSQMAGFQEHVAVGQAEVGAVVALPLIKSESSSEPGEVSKQWRNPLISARDEPKGDQKYFEAIEVATKIKELVGGVGESASLGFQFSDILILVRQRTHLQTYEEVFRKEGIPFSSNSYGTLLHTLEARDIESLLRFLTYPSSDIDLLQVLRSPIFGCTNNDLQMLAMSDGNTAWERLISAGDSAGSGCSSELMDAKDSLNYWLSLARRLPIHDLLDQVFHERSLLDRYSLAALPHLRDQVVENLKSFLEYSLDFNAGRYQTIPSFLRELSSIRRSFVAEGPDEGLVQKNQNLVRISTIHGAKGLESPIVFLMDATSSAKNPLTNKFLTDWSPDDLSLRDFHFCGSKDYQGDRFRELRELEIQLAEKEDLNLLYVALTRAKTMLFVSGVEKNSKDSTWYDLVREALGEKNHLGDVNTIRQLNPTCDDINELDSDGISVMPTSVEAVGTRESRFTSQEIEVGVLMHRLLEWGCDTGRLDRKEFWRNKLKASVENFDTAWLAAQSILSSRECKRFFDPDSYQSAVNEMSYLAANGALRRVDRFVEFQDESWVLDFKFSSGIDSSPVEKIAKPYIDQLTQYALDLSAIWPNKIIRSALIFNTGVLVELDWGKGRLVLN